MLVMVFGMATPVFAGQGKRALKRTKHGNVEQRVVNQERRIDRKEARGKITPEQAQAERSKVEGIAKERAEDLKANGGKLLTKDQRKGLNKELNETSKEIKGSSGPSVPATPAAPSGN